MSRHLRKLSALILLSLPGVGLQTSSCTATLDLEPVQCSSDADCVAIGSSTCVDRFCVSSCELPRADRTTTQEIVVTTFDTLGGTQYGGLKGGSDLQVDEASFLPNVQVKGCGAALSDCPSPLTETVKTNAKGQAILKLPGTFNGFIDVSGSDVYPTLYYPGMLLDESPRQYPIPVINAAAVAGLAALGNTEYDPSRAVLLAFVYDCADRFAAGYSFTIDPAPPEASSQFYIAGVLPDFKATQTDSVGYGGFVGLNPGLNSLSVWRGGVKQGTVQVLTRGGSVTLAALRARALFR